MAQTDSQRIEHDLTTLPVFYRKFRLDQILNDISEEDTGQGYSEVAYSGIFVNTITTWDTAAKALKRSVVTFNYSGAFVTGISKQIYDQDTGLTVVSTISAVVTYNPNNTVQKVTVTVSRP